MNFGRMRAILQKEVRELWRDPYTVAIALLMPLIFLFLFGYAFDFDVKSIPLAVWDQDQTAESRAYLQAYEQNGYFRVVARPERYEDIDELLILDQAEAAIVVPAGFGEALVAGRRVAVQAVVDGSFSPNAQVVMAYLSAVNARQSAGIVLAAVARSGLVPAGQLLAPDGGTWPGRAAEPIAVETRIWFNPTLSSKNFVVPGLFAVILMAFPPLLSALAVAREKEHGSIQQLFASPARPMEIIVGKLLPYAAVAFVEMLFVLAALLWWFDVPFRGSFWLFLLAATLYVITTVAVGLLASIVTRTQLAAMFLALVVALMPSMLFSGFLFPIYSMPWALQLYTYLFPARYFLEMSLGVILEGHGFGLASFNLALLAGYLIALLGLALISFQKRIG